MCSRYRPSPILEALTLKCSYGGIFTIHAASPETTKESYCQIARLGGLEGTENAGRHFLSQLSEPWLLIIDNADDPSLNLQDLYPKGDVPYIVITTRNPHFRKEGTLGSLELKGLREDEALKLLLVKADIPRPWDHLTVSTANMIAKALGYLALALIHAGNCIYRRICDLGDYLNLHSASRNILQRRKSLDGWRHENNNVIKAVYSTFDVSLDFLLRESTTRSKDASELLKIVSFYHFERIPVDIFTRAVLNRQAALKSPRHSFRARLLTELSSRLEPPKMLPDFLKSNGGELDIYRIKWAVYELRSLSLASYDDRDNAFSLHPLVHAWARDNLSIWEKNVWATIAFNTLMEAVSLPSEADETKDGDFHRQIMPHLDSCLQEHGNPISCLVHEWSPWRIQLTKILQPTWVTIIQDQVVHSAKCGYVLASCGQFENAASHLKLVKDVLISLLGIRHEKSMAAMLGLAGVLWGLGRLEEAILLQREVVNTRTHLYGKDDENTLEAMNQLGRSYWLHGQYQEALDLQQLACERARSVLDPSHPLLLSILDNLGVTLGSWQRWKESMQAHREALAGRREVLGDKHLDTWTTMSNLAMALLDLGQFEDAGAIMSSVHQQRQEQLGKEHPWTLWALLYLAKIYGKSGRLEEAEQMLIWGIEAGERSLSPTHLGVLAGRGELSRIYVKQSRNKEALELLTETVEQLQTNRGAAHPDCVYGLWKLARLHRIVGNSSKAIEICQLALERSALRLTREHPISQKIENMLEELQESSAMPNIVEPTTGGTIHGGAIRKSTTF